MVSTVKIKIGSQQRKLQVLSQVKIHLRLPDLRLKLWWLKELF